MQNFSQLLETIPLEKVCKLNVRKIFKNHLGCLLDVLRTFILRCVCVQSREGIEFKLFLLIPSKLVLKVLKFWISLFIFGDSSLFYLHAPIFKVLVKTQQIACYPESSHRSSQTHSVSYLSEEINNAFYFPYLSIFL